MNAAAPVVAVLALLATAADDPLAGRTAGPPVMCIDTQIAHQVEIMDAHTILYRETNRRIWRTGPDGPCPDLDPNATLIVEQYGPQLCRGDRFRVRREADPIPGGVCRFTAFTPYTKG